MGVDRVAGGETKKLAQGKQQIPETEPWGISTICPLLRPNTITNSELFDKTFYLFLLKMTQAAFC